MVLSGIAGVDPAKFDEQMMRAVTLLRDVLVGIATDWERADPSNENRGTFEEMCASASKNAVFEIVDGPLGSLKGVGFSTPYRQHNRASTLSPPVTISINPLDGLERFHDIVTNSKNNRAGVSTNMAVQVGGDVVAAYALEVYGDFLLRVPPYGTQLLRSLSDGSDEAPEQLERDVLSSELEDQTLYLWGDLGQYEGVLQLLQQPTDGTTGTFLIYEGAPHGSVEALRSLIWDMGAALAIPASQLVTPWIEWPLLKLAQATGIRLFRTADGALRELPLTPVSSPSMTVTRDYTLLFVDGYYVKKLSRRVPVQPLA